MKPEAKKIFEIFDGNKIYLVGGYVRDLLLGNDSNDLDFTTALTPQEIIDVLKKNNLKYWGIGKAFGTITTHINKLKIEITTYRTNESYTKDNRHPRVEFGTSLKDDLTRRDFTINALAMDRESNIINYFNGLQDLENKILKTPLDPNKTFSDDPLRMIRAVRFISKLGFSLNQPTYQGICNNTHKILALSVERIKTEMDKLLLGEHVDEALQMLMTTKLINYYLPELTVLNNMQQDSQYHHKDVWKHTISVVKNTPSNIILRWSALLHDIAKPYTKTLENGHIHFYNHEDLGAKLAEGILRRLKFSNEEIKEITILISNHMRPNLYTACWSDKAVKKLKTDVGELTTKLLKLSQADITSQNPNRVETALNSLTDLETRLNQPHIKNKFIYPISGYEIIHNLGLAQGTIIGHLKEVLKTAIESGVVPKNHYDKQVYFNYLKNYLNEISE